MGRRRRKGEVEKIEGKGWGGKKQSNEIEFSKGGSRQEVRSGLKSRQAWQAIRRPLHLQDPLGRGAVQQLRLQVGKRPLDVSWCSTETFLQEPTGQYYRDECRVGGL
jgi:hypothetical protein